MRSIAFAFLLLSFATPAIASGPPAHGVSRAYQDTTCAPCADFYRFANGAWVAGFDMPPAYSSYGTFDEVDDRNQEHVHALLEDAARRVSGAKAGSDEWKVGMFYRTCMDSGRAEAEGAKPLEPLLDRIAGVRSPADLARAVAMLQSQGITAMFRIAPRQDFKNSTATIAFLSQGGLGLPDRDYYFRADSQSTALRSAYRIHIERTLALSGIPAAESRPAAERILGLETALAAASRTNVEVRDPKSNYHAMSRSQLAALSPRVAWKEYFGALGTPELGTLNVAQPGFFHALDSLWSAVPLEDWKLYLRWHAARFASPWLSSAFVNENFSFESRLTGEKELKPRWKRCMAATDVALGEALGRQFVARYFTPATRQRALAMIGNLEAALRERLGTLEWMSDSTRTQALAKLRAFQRKIGYPDRWRDYSRLSVAPGSFLANRENAEGFEFRRRLAKIGKPVDRTEWTMTPPTVNAYYNSSMNEIVFPAGILQPPFFDPQADDAFNYGGIGTVIGHEMTHGFDDRGRQFDAAGNLRDWWTPADADRFKARAGRIIDQFNGYVAVDTVHVNGRLTTGENIADLGGLAIAYRAYQHARAGHPEPVVDGFTGDQRFFLAFAQIWREQVRPELARQDAATNPHSPGRWRVNGPLSNLPEFARAFGCREGDAMVRADDLKVRIW